MLGNGNDSGARSETLVGVSALARAIGKTKSTISKHAAGKKIPVAGYDQKGAPLFDVEAVRSSYGDDLNELMRRTPEGDDGGDNDVEAKAERRSTPSAPREPSALQRAAIAEKELKGRKLLGEIAEREGLTVLRSVVDLDQTTIARRTRDTVLAFMSDKASNAYAFAGQPRTEAEWRIWLTEQTREAFNHLAAQLALEDDDEFGDDDARDNDGGAGATDATGTS
jgi:hypothetical protein